MLEEGIYKAFKGSSMEKPHSFKQLKAHQFQQLKHWNFIFFLIIGQKKIYWENSKISCVGCVQEYGTLLPHGFFVNDFLVDPPRA